MTFRPLWLVLAAALALSGCAGVDRVYAPDEAVAAARYVSGEAPSVTLLTVINNRTGAGAHTALLIDGSQRVMYDPAGSWTHPRLPQRGDVFFGMTDRMVAFYLDYHTRVTYRLVEQTVPVTPEVAERVMQRALAQRPAARGFCAVSTGSVLDGVPGFEGVPRAFGPRALMNAFAAIPGVETRVITDDDADRNHGVLMVQAGDPRLTD